MNYKNIIKGFIKLALVFVGVSLVCIGGVAKFTPINLVGMILVLIGIIWIEIEDKTNNDNNHINDNLSVS